MLSKSALTGGGHNRCPPLEAFLGLNGGIFSGRFLNLPIGAENASAAFWGQKMLSGAEKIAPNLLNLRTQVSDLLWGQDL